jgi:protein phosphatase
VTEIGGSNPEFIVDVPGGGIVHLAWGAATDVGRRRAANEDSFIAQSPFFAVADGMGGHLAGDLASAAVVARLAEEVIADFIAPQVIERALDAATFDIDIVAGDSELGVGTTVTGAALTLLDSEPYFAVFNIGDSRVYQFEGHELKQVTVDHSLVQEMVDAGTITKAQAENHPESNIITRAVGFGIPARPDYWLLPLRTGLRLLMCSDGLTGELNDDRIRLHLEAGLTARETAHALVDAALAAGGKDNITVIIVEVVESPSYTDKQSTAPVSTHGGS